MPRLLKILLDENLSPTIAAALKNDGIDAIHLRERAGLGLSDEKVLELALAEDRILVSKNYWDFLILARKTELHPGIVILNEGNLTLGMQLEACSAMAGIIEKDALDLMNRVYLYSHRSGEFTLLF